ncbi:bifunctional 3-(3-hydroxy-phenyl)propionate/3-hydroxycinnamic acid hydroxylase [Hyalangium rubrum]|uniref:Bifunctional 3-(3-hydroxy-phenyl)propionate/3-hydroxycinnamic acid hydroxylase n=1 Tax=Hyalangium rubrum TaxID=3103134 RepID=A0ABU5GX55_9BACT|nr:bifunctional 3-(3-hydroxy-phenyl)propionate/3-hydroxycinnamic acid hydroxylase [Hyalangium sp. s54d21]MDY7225773.1 bifunctional 3-(3-hydroxy-phenyl)propionate/3-hydroxycinnamic acid hydroxylase [Hyalangium sp. s54d21]
MSSEAVDVIVVGCGPVGAMAANYLGLQGVRTLVIEQDISLFSQPRAFSCDDEAQRNFQAAGLVGEYAVELWPCQAMDYVDGSKRVLGSVPIGELDFGVGHPPLAFFSQPQLETVLRQGLRRFPHVELRMGHELVAFTQGPDFVTVQLKDRRTGRVREVRSRYLLGCDGSHSTVRRQMQVEMKGTSYGEPWIAISGTTPTSEPNFTYYVCDPVRPGFVTRGVNNEVRMDFLVKETERAETVEQMEVVQQLIAHYIDPRQLTLQRASVFTFQSKVAERWRDRRVFLLGDAAHLMPPFMGQGLCSGIRDAINLSWKLALALRGVAGDALLDTYERERRPHAENMIKATVLMGRVFLSRNRFLAALRNGLLQLLFRIPRTRRMLRSYEFKPKMVLDQGFVAGGRRRKDSSAEGSYLPQPWVGLAGGSRVRLDEVLGSRFAVLVRDEVAEPVRQSAEALAQELEGVCLRVLPSERAREARQGDVVDVEGKLGEWFSRHQADAVVVRPDRYIYGAARGPGLEVLREELRGFIQRPESRRSDTTPSQVLLSSGT